MLAPFSLSSTTSVESSPSIIYANKLKHWLLYLYVTDIYVLLIISHSSWRAWHGTLTSLSLQISCVICPGTLSCPSTYVRCLTVKSKSKLSYSSFKILRRLLSKHKRDDREKKCDHSVQFQILKKNHISFEKQYLNACMYTTPILTQNHDIWPWNFVRLLM